LLSGDWVDLGRAVFESGVARFVVDGYVCGRVREFLSGDIKARSGDRAVNYPPFIPGVNVAEADSWDKKI